MKWAKHSEPTLCTVRTLLLPVVPIVKSHMSEVIVPYVQTPVLYRFPVEAHYIVTYVYIGDDMGWVVSVVAAIGLGFSRVCGGDGDGS